MTVHPPPPFLIPYRLPSPPIPHPGGPPPKASIFSLSPSSPSSHLPRPVWALVSIVWGCRCLRGGCSSVHLLPDGETWDNLGLWEEGADLGRGAWGVCGGERRRADRWWRVWDVKSFPKNCLLFLTFSSGVFISLMQFLQFCNLSPGHPELGTEILQRETHFPVSPKVIFLKKTFF